VDANALLLPLLHLINTSIYGGVPGPWWIEPFLTKAVPVGIRCLHPAEAGC